ncbi:MAG: DUF6491 family protein [Sphingomicrobium sp.]
MLNRPTIFALATCGAAIAAFAISACSTNPAPAGTAARSSGQCFLASNVNSYNANADGTVDIQAGASQYFRLTTAGGCPDINWSMQVGIRSTGGSDFICNGYDAEFVVPDPSGTQRCQIASVTPITRDQYKAATRKK